MSSYREKEKKFINKEIEFLNKLDISDNDMAAVKMSIKEAYRNGYSEGNDIGFKRGYEGSKKYFKVKMDSLLERISMEFERVKS
jgi:flagellar biosynthesis/type III secretory pathway protein FliH